jgi:hypothetical protein
VAFVKGDVNINRNGRPIGAINRNTANVKELIFALYELNLEEISKHFDNLTIEQRLQLNKDLLPYLLSKERSTIQPINPITDNEIVVKIVRD